jgi:glycosyltransferase involved in cell wall biosynthesis
MRLETPDPRPLNVVRIISFMNVGGVQGMLLATLPQFDRSRFNMRVVCTSRSGEFGRELVGRGVPVDVVPMRGRLNPVGLWRLARWLRAQRADIVHTHMYASNVTGTLAARLAGVPVIVSHIHSLHEWRTPGRRRIERFCDRLRSGYLAVSAAARDGFLESTGLSDPQGRVRVLHNVARPLGPADGSDADPAALRAELGIPAGAPVVGTIARLVPIKGLDVLLRAARRVVERVPEVRFVLVGGGREREALARQAADLGLVGRVNFTGERLEVAALYRLFDCFALPSRSEGCSNVLLEAMQVGLPIVATCVGGIKELVRDGAQALLVAPEDDAALADALVRVLTDAELARRLAAAARDRSREFTIAAYVEKVQLFYDELFARSKRTPPEKDRT